MTTMVRVSFMKSSTTEAEVKITGSASGIGGVGTARLMDGGQVQHTKVSEMCIWLTHSQTGV